MFGTFLNGARRATLGVLLLAALVVVLLRQSHAGEPARSTTVRLVEPEHLSAATRAELQGRMARHGNVMSNLVRAVVLLEPPDNHDPRSTHRRRRGRGARRGQRPKKLGIATAPGVFHPAGRLLRRRTRSRVVGSTRRIGRRPG